MTSSQNNIHPKKEGSKKWIKIILIILAIFLCLLIVLGATFLILRQVGKNRLLKDNPTLEVTDIEDVSTNDNIIEYKGNKYIYNKNIVSVLVMGIDKEIASNNNFSGKNGQADTLFLATLDTRSGNIKIIPIPRETMVDIDLYSPEGTFLGVENNSICLAYAYGNNPQKSSENVLRSANRLFLGINISSFVTMDLKAVSELTSAIGGLRITALETIPNIVKQGQTITLNKNNVSDYIKWRNEDLLSSTRRLDRQKQFFSAFAIKAGNMVRKDFSTVTHLYNIAKPYTVTDIDFSEVTYLASCAITADLGKSIEYLIIDGNMQKGEQHAEFFPDKTSVFETVLNAFYIKK